MTTYLQGLLSVRPTAAAVIGLHGLGEMCHVCMVDLACMQAGWALVLLILWQGVRLLLQTAQGWEKDAWDLCGGLAVPK